MEENKNQSNYQSSLNKLQNNNYIKSISWLGYNQRLFIGYFNIPIHRRISIYYQDTLDGVSPGVLTPHTREIYGDKKKPALKDYSTYTVEQLREEFETLKSNYSLELIKHQVEEINKSIKTIFSQEREVALKKYIEINEDVKGFHYKNENIDQLFKMIKGYKTELSNFYKNQQEEQDKNLNIRLSLINQLKDLYSAPQGEKNIISQFKEIKKEWDKVGMIPKDQISIVFKTYYHHLDNFYEYLNLNKELQEMDYAQNLKMRESIIERASKLLEEKDVRKALNELQYLHKLWKTDAVPVAPEHREPTWLRFKDITQKIHEKKESQNEEFLQLQKSNLAAKENILNKIETILSTEKPSHSKDWYKYVKEVDQLLNEFCAVGSGPRKEDNILWAKFKKLSKEHNHEKNQFYKTLKEGYNENIAKKRELINIANEHKESVDWESSIDILKRIQADWKKVGFIPKDKSDKLWAEFKSACDHFFERYKNKSQIQKQEQGQINQAKQAFLEDLKNKKLNGDEKQILDELNAIITKWHELGASSYSKKEIDSDFNKIIQELSIAHNIDMQDLEERQSTQMVEKLKNSDDIAAIEKEIHRSDLILRKLKEEILQLENNMGFFIHSDKNNPLIKNVQERLDQKNAQLNLHHNKIKDLKIYLRGLLNQDAKKEDKEEDIKAESEN